MKRTERGWGGHFIASNYCLFRRNTLLEYNDIKIVISTVGNHQTKEDTKPQLIGVERYYETMCFIAEKDDKYNDADVTKQINFDSKWMIGKDELNDDFVDNIANDMHENVVEEIKDKLSNGIII